MTELETTEISWDAKPARMHFRGQNHEMFTRTALATALGRSSNTIRLLEYQGVLCHPRLKNGRGWWMYTRQQIEDLIELAREENVLDPRKRNSFSERFITEARKILRRYPDGSPK